MSSKCIRREADSFVATLCATLTIISLKLFSLRWNYLQATAGSAPSILPDNHPHSDFFFFFFARGSSSNSLFCVCDLFLSIPPRYASHSQSDYFSPCQLTLPSPVIPPSIFNVMFFFPPSLLLVGPAELLLSLWLAVSLFVRAAAAMTRSRSRETRRRLLPHIPFTEDLQLDESLRCVLLHVFNHPHKGRHLFFGLIFVLFRALLILLLLFLVPHCNCIPEDAVAACSKCKWNLPAKHSKCSAAQRALGCERDAPSGNRMHVAPNAAVLSLMYKSPASGNYLNKKGSFCVCHHFLVRLCCQLQIVARKWFPSEGANSLRQCFTRFMLPKKNHTVSKGKCKNVNQNHLVHTSRSNLSNCYFLVLLGNMIEVHGNQHAFRWDIC